MAHGAEFDDGGAFTAGIVRAHEVASTAALDVLRRPGARSEAAPVSALAALQQVLLNPKPCTDTAAALSLPPDLFSFLAVRVLCVSGAAAFRRCIYCCGPSQTPRLHAQPTAGMRSKLLRSYLASGRREMKPPAEHLHCSDGPQDCSDDGGGRNGSLGCDAFHSRRNDLTSPKRRKRGNGWAQVMVLQPGGWVAAFTAAAADQLRLPHRAASLLTLQVALDKGSLPCDPRCIRLTCVRAPAGTLQCSPNRKIMAGGLSAAPQQSGGRHCMMGSLRPRCGGSTSEKLPADAA